MIYERLEATKQWVSWEHRKEESHFYGRSAGMLSGISDNFSEPWSLGGINLEWGGVGGAFQAEGKGWGWGGAGAISSIGCARHWSGSIRGEWCLKLTSRTFTFVFCDLGRMAACLWSLRDIFPAQTLMSYRFLKLITFVIGLRKVRPNDFSLQ